ncbi:MAG: response regulator [Methanospirillum sp.]|nr:response regulator [Methanospirillum sp.]
MNHATVLVVEDEIIVGMDIMKTLESMHYHPICAVCNADEAIFKAHEFLPDVILMDIGIPGTVDGLGAAQIIRDELDIPVIFVTAYGDDAIIEKAKRVHPYGYVLKPIRERDLKISIDLALSRKSREMQDRKRGTPALPTGTVYKPDEATGAYTSLSDIRSLFLKGFFKDVVLFLYSNTEVKEQVFTSFIERSLNARGDVLFAYSLSRAHKVFLQEIQKGKIRICRMKSGELQPLKKTLSDYSERSGSTDPVPLRIIIDFSERHNPDDLQASVDQVIALRDAGVPVSGIIALAVGTCEDSLISVLSQKIPNMVVATSRGTLISSADQSFPLESLSYLPQSVVDETVKKVLEPVVLSLLEKPISGHDILEEIRGRYNISVPKARVYMQLYALQKRGYLSVSTVGKSKVYAPTESGKKHIRQKLDEFKSTFHHILAEMADKKTGNNNSWEKRE